ncbi:PA14 domain-containing protein [Rhodococcus sp. IEGM1300]
MALNPTPVDAERNAIVHRDIKRKPFKDMTPEGDTRPIEGGRDDRFSPVAKVEDEKKEIAYGVGSMEDLKLTLPDEDEPISFMAQSRLVGEALHESMHFPEQEFGYSVQKKGKRLVSERRSGYEVRVDAHPEKRINGTLTHELRGTKRFNYEATIDVNAGAPRAEYRARLKWAGRKILRSQSDVKSLFVAKNTIHVTKAGEAKATWVRQGNDVIDVKNAPHMSGVISGDHLDKSRYQAEFEFTPTYTTQKGTANAFVNVRRVNSSFRTYKGSGWGQGKYWDDDIVGLIFKAKSKRDFYMLLWEGEERLAGSSRINNLDKYKIDHPTLFVHGNNTAISGISGAANDGRGAIDKNKWVDYRDNKGWGKAHARVFRVKDGIIHEVTVKDHRSTKRGWLFGKRQGMRVVSNGKEVTLYLKTNTAWEKAFEFDTAYEEGSFGMCNISQAVLFHKISYQEHAPIIGYIPEQGWFRTRKQEHIVSTDAKKYVSAKAKARYPKDFYDVTHISLLEDPKTASVGTFTSKWPNGPLTMKTKNPPPDAVLIKTIKKSGYVDIEPSINSPWNHTVVFDGALAFFQKEIDDWLKRTGATGVTDYSFDVTRPTNEDDDDWDILGEDNEKLIAWNARVKQEVVDVSIPVYAYEGSKRIPLTEWFGLNENSVASIDIDEETFDRFHDSCQIEGVGEDLAVIVKTTEWYKGAKVPHMKLNGEVSSMHPLELEIPSVPEHYEDIHTGAPMYHGHETVRLTLTQLAPLDQTVSGKFGQSGDATTSHANALNETTGRPLVMTPDENDRLIVSALPDPREVQWFSSKKEGAASVNGLRPFLSQARGYQEAYVGMEDIIEPPDLISVDGYEITTNNEMVRHRISDKGAVFYSNRETPYRFTKPWVGSWEQDPVERSVTRERISIPDMTEPSRQEVPENVFVSGMEVAASDPFVEMKARTVTSQDVGLLGRYHQREHSLDVVTETIEVEGAAGYYQQSQMMHEWEDEIAFKLIEGAEGIEATVEGRATTYRRLGDNLVFDRATTGAGTILVKYRVGQIRQEYFLKKVHGTGVEVFLGSEKLDGSGYTIRDGVLTLAEEPFGVEVITVRSLRVLQPYGEGRTDLGRFHGARIDKEIWFDWGAEGPFPLVNEVIGQTDVHQVDVRLALEIEKRHDYALTDVEQWSAYDGARSDDGANVGGWSGPSAGYNYIVSQKNQGAITAKLDPVYGNGYLGISAGLTVMPTDDDAVGFLFIDEAKKEHIMVGWDSGGGGFNGLSVERWTCTNPEQYGSQNLVFTKKSFYNDPLNTIGQKDPASPGSILARADRHLSAIYDARQKQVILVVDGGEPMKVDVDMDLGEMQAGLFTYSQADSRFTDIVRISSETIDHEKDVRLSTTLMETIERPQVTNTQRDFTFEIGSPVASLFDEASIAGEGAIVGRRYSVANTISDGVFYFESTTTGETRLGNDTLSLILRGKMAEVGLPEWVEQAEEGAPNIPEVDLPPVSTHDAFSVEWVGEMLVEATGRHEFEIVANEGVILEVDDKEVIRAFGVRDGRTLTGGIDLVAGRAVKFRLRCYENDGIAYVRLRMKEPNGKMRRIPEERFRTGASFMVEAKKMDRYPEAWHIAIDNGDYFFGKEEHHLYAEEKTEIHALSTSKQITLNGENHQGAPLMVTRGETTFKEIVALDEYGKKTFDLYESFKEEGLRRLLLGVEDVREEQVRVWRNEVLEPFIVEGRHVVIGAPIGKDDEIVVRHSDIYGCHTEWVDGKTVLTFHPELSAAQGPVTVTYESSEERREFITNRILQPLRTRAEGMVWIEEEKEGIIGSVELKLSRNRVKEGSIEKVTLFIQVKDSLGNSVSGADVTVQHPEGTLSLTSGIDGSAKARVTASSGMYIVKAGEAFDVKVISKGDATKSIAVREKDRHVKAELLDEQGQLVREISSLMVYNGIETTILTVPAEGIKVPYGQRLVYVAQEGDEFAICKVEEN